VDLLSFVSDKSPLVGLERAHAKWVSAVEALEGMTDSGAKPGAGRDVQDAFDVWLSGFRGVDYFTREWIGGREDAEAVLKRFEAFTREEFDANAAYRACVALRNVAQHAGKSINAMSWGTTLAADGGDAGGAGGAGGAVSHYVNVCVDLPKLAASSSGRFLSAARLREFEATTSLVSVDLLVGFATQASVRMFYRLVDAVGSEVEEACGVVAGFHREAVAAGGASAVFVTNAEGFVRLESGMEMRNNGHDQLVAVHDLLPDIARAVGAPVHVGWADLMAVVT
jgi:hypothetical protein